VVGFRSIGRWPNACTRARENGLRETRRGTANSSGERAVCSSAARTTNSEESQPILFIDLVIDVFLYLYMYVFIDVFIYLYLYLFMFSSPHHILSPILENPPHLPPFSPDLITRLSSEAQLDDLLFDGRHINKRRLFSICFTKLCVDLLVGVWFVPSSTSHKGCKQIVGISGRNWTTRFVNIHKSIVDGGTG
jgi:hypothetical protein